VTESGSDYVPSALRSEISVAARELLSAEAEPSTAAPEGSADPVLWRRVSDLGWAGITVPVAHGGLGLDFADLCAVVEETGRFLLGLPLADTAVCGLGIERFAPAHAAELLPAIAEGKLIGTTAFDSAATVDRSAGGLRVSGEARFVVHGATAGVVFSGKRNTTYSQLTVTTIAIASVDKCSAGA
jgi:alkylation response protein AidB-like acyl-CoA dehydrogenase